MKWEYSFEGRIVHHLVGTYRYTVVFLPSSLADELPFVRSPRLRFRGVIGGVAFHGAWQPVRGRWYCMLSKKVVQRSGYRVSELALVRFNLEDSEKVELPEVLEEALAENPKALAAWKLLSVGKRRGHAYHLASAKKTETISRRLQELIALLEASH